MTGSVITLRQFSHVALLAIALPCVGRAQSPPLWGKLSAGLHPVGYKSLWQLDYSRRYNMTFDDKTTYAPGKAPRPILINIWYPAKANGSDAKMRHREYFEILSSDPQLTKFSSKLVEFNLSVLGKELFNKPFKELNEPERPLLNQFLDTPTQAIRNAPPADGTFPLVIYHSGHGSSFEDNSVLCEFLASHGYVVLGSAYQKPDGSSFGVDGHLTSARDIEFLIAYARQMPGVDWNHVGIIGHSGGAHAALVYRAQTNCAADAIVSLDTTQDYYSLADNRWEDMTTTVLKNRKNMTGPLLMAANPHGFFQLADSLWHARRYYLTIKNLDHNDFISQGVIAKTLRYGRQTSNQPADEVQDKASLDAVQVAYEALCIYILRFLDAELKGDAAGKEFISHQYRDTKLEGAAPHVEFTPEGRAGPEPYVGTSSQPPTPRQVRQFLRERGCEETIALFRRFRKQEPTQPIYHPVFGLALVTELLEQGKTKDAIAFRDYFREIGTDCGKMLLDWGKAYVGMGLKDRATGYFKKVLLLDPTNGEAARKLKELAEAKDKSSGP